MPYAPEKYEVAAIQQRELHWFNFALEGFDANCPGLDERFGNQVDLFLARSLHLDLLFRRQALRGQLRIGGDLVTVFELQILDLLRRRSARRGRARIAFTQVIKARLRRAVEILQCHFLGNRPRAPAIGLVGEIRLIRPLLAASATTSLFPTSRFSPRMPRIRPSCCSRWRSSGVAIPYPPALASGTIGVRNRPAASTWK